MNDIESLVDELIWAVIALENAYNSDNLVTKAEIAILQEDKRQARQAVIDIIKGKS